MRFLYFIVFGVSFVTILIGECHGGKTNSTKDKRDNSASRKPIGLQLHKQEGETLESAASNHGSGNGRDNRQRTYQSQQDSKPKSYSQSYDSGPQYYEVTSKPVKYHREYHSPPSSYSTSYNTGPQSSSYSSPPQQSSHRDSYNHQDGNEHRDGDEQTNQDHSSYGGDDDGYGGGGGQEEYGNNDDNGYEGSSHSDYENDHGNNNLRY